MYPVTYIDACINEHLSLHLELLALNTFPVLEIPTIPSNVPSKLCMCVCAHTGHEMSSHKKIWSTHKFFVKNVFSTYFIHVVLNIDECY